MSIVKKEMELPRHPRSIRRSALRAKSTKRTKTPSINTRIKSINNFPPQQIQTERLKTLEREEQTRNLIIKAEEICFCNVNADYAKKRSTILRSIEEISINLRLHRKTYYLAIALIDKLLSTCNCDQYSIPLLCMVAVNIAAKFNEKPTKKLNIAEIMKLQNGKYSEEIIRACEIDILTKLQFKISLVTVYDLVQELMSVSQSAKQKSDSNKDLIRKRWLIKEAVTMFVEISINDYRFQFFPIIIVALSCIVSTMQLLGFQSFIDPNLSYLLLNNNAEIDDCVRTMFEYANRIINSSTKPNKKDVDQHSRKRQWTSFSQLYELENRKRLSKYSGLDLELRNRECRRTKDLYKTYKDIAVMHNSDYVGVY